MKKYLLERFIKNDFDEVFSLLEENMPEKEHDLILLKSRYEEVRRKELTGIDHLDTINVEKNKIRDFLLKNILEIKEDSISLLETSEIELSLVLEDRFKEIYERLLRYSINIEVDAFLKEFRIYHERHIKALSEKKYFQAHEILRRIYFLMKNNEDIHVLLKKEQLFYSKFSSYEEIQLMSLYLGDYDVSLNSLDTCIDETEDVLHFYKSLRPKK